MVRQGRAGIGFGPRQELWRRWKAGETQSGIAQALGVSVPSVFAWLKQAGGIAPALRMRREGCLSHWEREEISRGLAAGLSLRGVSRQLGRAASSISREVRRNGGAAFYRATLAEDRALRVALRPKPCCLAIRPVLRDHVAQKLAENWSPQQVAGWLKVTYPEDLMMQVSHETIYKTLFIQTRGALKAELVAHLRSRRIMRRAKTASPKGQGRGTIPDAISIRARPAEIEDRAVPGHWEGDLLCGAANSYIATLVERTSRYVMLVKLNSKATETVVKALITHAQTLPKGLMTSLTWDRGSEMSGHRKFSLATDIAVYFCDPQSPWQRGSNENTNGLLRQYFPKGQNLSRHSQQDLDAVALSLNTRPRQTLGFLTPARILEQAVALTP
jgi:IS30 family transposase